MIEYNSPKPNMNMKRYVFRYHSEMAFVFYELKNDIDLFERTSIARLHYFCGLTYTEEEKSLGWTKTDWPEAVMGLINGAYTIIFPEAKEIEPLF